MNKKLTFRLLGLLFLTWYQSQAARFPADSIGIEKKDGKVFILHRVEDGQTLYGIARRYNSSVETIQSANPTLGAGLQFNQVIRIPTTIAVRKEAKAASADKIDESELYKPEPKPKNAKEQAELDVKAAQRIEKSFPKTPGIHIVEAGQTLYSLSVRYGVLQSEIRTWNNLTNDNLKAGQELIVSEKAFAARHASGPAETAVKPAAPKPEVAKAEPARPEPVKSETPKAEPPKTEPGKAVTTKPESAKPALGKPSPVEPTISAEKTPVPALPSKGRRISEIGMADVIDPTDTSPKLLALHRTAPTGTLVQVRNDINNTSLWVKVIGKLPDTGVNDRILIKLSARAFEKLSPNQQRFRAEVSYMAP
nr:LysM peptidoglycan-binding domain-containing protein [uncultured Arsenicibacter sp.]